MTFTLRLQPDGMSYNKPEHAQYTTKMKSLPQVSAAFTLGICAGRTEVFHTDILTETANRCKLRLG
jgi:hypothetical protein